MSGKLLRSPLVLQLHCHQGTLRRKIIQLPLSRIIESPHA